MAQHFMDKASWLWSIGEAPENWYLYFKETVVLCDLRAEMNRWDRMYKRYSRRSIKDKENVDAITFD
jgi:hypothetical protein